MERGGDFVGADAMRRKMYEGVLRAIRDGNIYYKEMAEEAVR